MVILTYPRNETNKGGDCLNKRLLAGRMVMAGYTQVTAAEALGVSKNTFNAKMNGHGPFDADQIIRLCELFGIEDSHDKVQIFLTRANADKH